MKDNVDVRRLAVVLRHANTAPPSGEIQRLAFYAMKQRICEQYGERDGDDFQHIKKDCWGYRNNPCDQHCDRCGGSGVYSEKFVVLSRWKIGGLIFHRPERTMAWPTCQPTIVGLIRHKRSRMAEASRMALELAFTGSWGVYASAFAMSDDNLRRFKAALTYLLGIDRRRWPGVRLRFPEIEEAAKKFQIPF